MLRRLLHKIVPPENSLPLAITGLMNLIAFSGPKLLQVLGWSLPMHDMTAAFDRAFPFPRSGSSSMSRRSRSGSISIPSWPRRAAPCAIALCGRFCGQGDLPSVFRPAADAQCPPAAGNGRLYGLGHADDLAAGHPTNLFPSIHCFVSWLGTRYIYECRSLRHRGLTCTLCTVGSVLVFLATMFTKQHVFYDVISGVAVAEIGWLVARYTGLPRLFERLNGRFLRTKLAQMI